VLRRSLLPMLALVLLVTGMSPGVSAAPASGGDTQYLGRWNYDQPDYATMTNIAEMNVAGGLLAPQIGDVVFTREADSRIVGRTDVGCTWRFRVTPGALELDPPSQLCHNPTMNAAYTITRWTVTVSGQRERETVEATSHQPDRDYLFVLRDGARTKARASNTRDFLGSWSYDPADPATGVNMRITSADSQPVTIAPEQGTVRIVGDYENRVTARTGDGCTWSLLVRGNTAKLDPPVQTCIPTGTAAVTVHYWTIASDGTQQVSIIIGTDRHGGRFVISKGSLTKR
jgi:hypothetical protein